MLTTRKRSTAMLVLSLLAATALQSCGGGTPSKMPTRSKLPGDFNSAPTIGTSLHLENTQVLGGYPVKTGFVDMESSGGPATYYAVALPAAADDETVLSLLQTYRPLLQPMLAQWLQQQPYPVLIDLRGPGSHDLRRSDYRITQPGAFALPLVILSDSRSAARLNAYQKFLRTAPDIQISAVAAGGFGSDNGCFESPGHF